MPTRALCFLSFVAISALASCGGETTSHQGTSGSGGTGAAGSSGSGGTAGTAGTAGTSGTSGTAGNGGAAGTGGVPDGCLLPVSQPGPYSVTFQLQNPSPEPITLWQDCDLGQTISSCESSYTTTLAISGDCTISCSDTSGGCIACGACMSQATTLAPNEIKEVTWSGLTYTFGQVNGCSCSTSFVAPAAHYRFSIPIYPMIDPNSPKPAPLRTVTQDFVLPTAGGVVSVNLAQ